MFYAVRHINTVLVVAADTLLEFETFANNYPETGSHYLVERADILDMLGDQMFAGYSSAPVKIMCENEQAVDQAIEDFSLVVEKPHQGIDRQIAMLERARLEALVDQPPDRRTLAEVHNLVDDDPWDKSTDEQKAAAKKDDERMRAVRAAGGLTGDSFDTKVGDKMAVHSVHSTLDRDGDISSIDVVASKNTIVPYELVIDGLDVDLEPVWEEMKLPDNRILSHVGNRLVIKLHDFQTTELSAILDRHGLTYSLNHIVDENIPEGEETFGIEGHASFSVFYSVQVDTGTVHAMIPLLDQEGFDTNLITTMRNMGRGCWLAFLREAQARECSAIIQKNNHACAVVAINRNGQAIVSGDHNYRVVDTNEQADIGPRPWNDRASEIDAMSDEEKAALYKTVQPSEYLICVEHHDRLRTVVYITPESYFRDTGEFWQGELILDMIPDEKSGSKMLTRISPFMFKGGLESRLMKDNMCRWGFVDSMLLRIHINEMLSEQKTNMQ